MATMSRPLRSATVTFHCPARNVFCKPSERREIGVRFVKIPLLVQSLLQATKIARRLVHVRLGDLDVIEADDRIDLDRMRLRALADDLPMNLTFGRHVDDEIAANPGLASEPPAGGERSALRGVAGLDLSRWRHMIGARMNSVLGEIALRDVDLTAAANAAPAADRIEIDAERARGFEQTCAVGELAPLAGGREDDAMGQEINRSKVIQSRVGPVSCHARGSAHPASRTLSGNTLRQRWTPAFAGVTHGAAGAQLAHHAQALAPIVLGQNRQAMRIVFGFQPLGGSRQLPLSKIVAARNGLAAPPFGKIGVVALRAGMHRRRVDRANETLRQLALGRRTSSSSR